MAKRSPKKKAVQPSLPSRAALSRLVLLQAGVLVAAAIWIYWPALGGAWLWDDDTLVSDNRDLRTWSGLGKIWFSSPETDYWPLTWTLFWIEWHLWGNEPLGFHLVSLALHIGSGMLVWRLFNRLGMRGGWLGGLLFVIHPLAVESVAWIAELKNTLSLPLYLLAFGAWIDAEEQKPLGYVKSVLYYLAAMLAKTSTVMLPAVLLLYGWWKRGRISRVEIVRMIPYGLIALTLGLITVYFQNNGHDFHTIEHGGLVARLIGAGTAVCFYLGKFILPIDLLPIYPRWTLDPPSLLEVLTLPALAALLWALWSQRRGWGRHALFGFGFFLLNLLPVLGLVRMVYLSITWVADHMVYVPMIGLIGLFAAAWGELGERMPASFRVWGMR
jgi:hypothetical protein